jgi:hypothetical protein
LCVFCLGLAGCGAPVVAPSTAKPIAVDDTKHEFVRKALKDAGIEGEVVSVDLFDGKYHVMVQAPSAAPTGASARGGEVSASGGDSFTPPRSYVIGQDGKVKSGL